MAFWILHKMIKRIICLCHIIILAFFTQNAMAQLKTVIYDKVHHIPVSYVNVFRAEKGSFKGTTSDENGNVSIDFDFRQLNVSHVNYQPITLLELPDTIFLMPKENILKEVVIKDMEPQWIRPLLSRFVGESKSYYRSKSEYLNYTYLTRNVSDSNGYWFENTGAIRFPSLAENRSFQIKPSKGYIHYKDNSAGCDFTNMKRMLYHDFVEELDEKFIKKHSFRINDSFQSDNKDIVQLYFKSIEYGRGDKGYINIDTAKCIIHSVIRETELPYNVDNNTNSFTRSTVNIVTGWKYSEWYVKQEIVYHLYGDSYYPSSCRYKAYISAESKKGKYAGSKFDSFESEISFSQCDRQDSSGFIELQEPWYMKIIVSKKERLAEEQLQKIPTDHILY